jgi:Protein of unknown function (DUF1214)
MMVALRRRVLCSVALRDLSVLHLFPRSNAASSSEATLQGIAARRQETRRIAWTQPLYFGGQSPGKDNESNWLPAPAGNFSLLMRHYWPETTITNGTWMPPDVEKTN